MCNTMRGHNHVRGVAVGPPLLFPVYFQFMLFRHIYLRKLWLVRSVISLYNSNNKLLYSTIFWYAQTMGLDTHTKVNLCNISVLIRTILCQEWTLVAAHSPIVDATCFTWKCFRYTFISLCLKESKRGDNFVYCSSCKRDFACQHGGKKDCF